MKNTRTKNFLLLFLFLFLLFSFCPGYGAMLKIKNLSPDSGGPGDTITLWGEGFGMNIREGKVLFGTTPGKVISWTDSKIEVLIPNELKSEDLVQLKKEKKMPLLVEVGNQKSDARYFDPLPHIKSLSPSSGGPGETITIRGENFGGYIDLGRVFVGSSTTEILTWKENEITCKLPNRIETADIKSHKKKRTYIPIMVQVGNLKSDEKEFHWETAISGISPQSAGVGCEITIKGKDMGKETSGIQVIIGDRKLTPIMAKGDQLKVLLPTDITNEELKEGKIAIRINAGGVISNEYLYEIKPVIFNIKPTKGRGGDVEIRGRNLGTNGNDKQVSLKSSAGESLTVKILSWTDEEIKLEIPTDKEYENDTIFKLQLIMGKLVTEEKDWTYLRQKHKKNEKKEQKKEEEKEN